MDKHDYVILGLVLLFGILAVLLFTGASEADYDMYGQAGKSVVNKPVSCIETDDGANFFLRGTTYMSNKKKDTFLDYCRAYDSPVLVEYYCNDGKILSKDYTCPFGCELGACNRQPVEVCGDGVVQVPEQCDGMNIPMSCTEFDPDMYVGGFISCLPPGTSNECQFDLSQCITREVVYCGDGVRNGYEQCDGLDLGGLQCSYIGSYTGGILSCNDDCTVNTQNCDIGNGFCGDTIINNFPNEQCDGSLNSGAWGNIYSCVDFGFIGGTLTCNSPNEMDKCQFDTSQCISPGGSGYCGDMILNPGEECEAQRPLTLDCTDFDSFVGGYLACDYSTCQYDISGCEAQLVEVCGDGVVTGYEQCDGMDLRGVTCDMINGYTGGILTCSPDCMFDTSQCNYGNDYCGDGVINNFPYEECDGSDLAGMSCINFGFPSGTLTCTPECQFDLVDCIAY